MIGMSLHRLKCAHDMFMLLFVLSSKCRTNKMMLTGTCPGSVVLLEDWPCDSVHSYEIQCFATQRYI